MKERLHAEIEQAQKALQEDLKEFGIVGNGFWEATEQSILAEIRKWLEQKLPDCPIQKTGYSAVSELLEEIK